MANFLKNLFAKDPTSVSGVDIGPSSIKIVQLKKKKGRAVLERYGALSLGPYAGVEIGRATALPADKIASAVLDLMREAKISAKDCGFSIPMSSSLVTIIEIPEVEEKQLASIIPIEARKYVPVPISEVLLDWWVIPREGSMPTDEYSETRPGALYRGSAPKQKTIEVLLVVIHNEAIAKAQDVIKMSGLRASFYEIEIFSTIRSALDREGSPVMLFDFGAGSTKLYIVDRGVLRVSHVINRGSQDLTIALSKALNISPENAESMERTKGLTAGTQGRDTVTAVSSTLNYIFAETNRVILTYEKKHLKNLGKILLTGGGAGLKGLLEVAQTSFQTEVVLANPFGKVESPAFLEGVLKQVGPEFAVSVGLALRKLQEIR